MAGNVSSFFQKHPGCDAYSLFWLVIFLILGALSRLYLPLLIPAIIVLLYLLFRLFSRKVEKRQMENARFMALLQSIFRWFKHRRAVQTDRQYYYFKCPNCGQPMRVPRGLGKVQINCRSCNSQFETKS